MKAVDDQIVVSTPPIVGVRPWDGRSVALLLCVLFVASLVALRGITVGEFSYNVDETQHAVTGVFISDLIRDHPLAHPVLYTERYYAQYPALSGLIHWPPLFYIFEGMFFLVLGPTVVAARLSILFFTLLALSFWFCLMRNLMNEWAAALSTLWLAWVPSVLVFEKTVMLEIPLLACCTAAIFFWFLYLIEDRKSYVYWFAIAASAALLTKQNAIFLVPFCVASGWFCAGKKLFLRAEIWRAVAICILLAAPYYAVNYLVHWKTIAADLTEKGAGGRDWLFYWKVLPGQLGWTLFGFGVLGMLTSQYWGARKVSMMMLIWVVTCYLTFTLIGHKEGRYIIYWLPPFLYFACGLLLVFFRNPRLKAAGGIAALVVLGAILVPAWSFHRPYVAGYAAVPRKILEESKSGIILFDGPLPGNFIFFMRADDPARRFLVLRKALHTTNLKRSIGSVEMVHSQQDIVDLFREDGVRFIVVSENFPLPFESEKLLREVLKNPVYKELGRFPIEGNDLKPANCSLVLYENLNWTPPSAKYLRIKMLTTGHDIVVPFDAFVDPGNKQAGR